MNKQKLYKYAKKVNRWKQDRRLNWVIKFTVVALLSIALYQQIFGKDNIEEIYEAFIQKLSWDNAFYLAFAVILMPVNWMLEAVKWKRLVKPIEDVPLLKAIEGIFAGVTLSLFTPNRVGEYGGRILVVKPENNVKTVVATLVGSFSQLTVLLVMGMSGMSYFIYLNLQLDAFLLYTIIFCSLLIAALLVFFYLNVDLLIPIFKRIPFVRRFVKHIKILKKYQAKELFLVLIFSLCRYLVYSLQYYVILRFLGIEMPLLHGLSSIALIFLVQTSIPLPPITGLLMRGEVALYVWGFYNINEISILAATFSLWFINVILPALLGVIFILNVNVLKSLGFDTGKKEEA